MTDSATPDVPRWRKSTFSVESNCIELAALPDQDIAVRDSNDPGHTIAFTRQEVAAFLRGVKAGEFDDLIS